MRSSSRFAGIWVILFTACAVLGTGCPKKDQEAESKAKKPPVAKTQPAAEPVIKASEDDCVGRIVRSGKPKEITIQDQKYKLDGYLLSQVTQDPDEEVKIGVISDTKENTEENRKNLEKIMEIFKKEKVDAILHLGDVASTVPMPEEIEVPEKNEEGKELTDAEKERFRRRAFIKARRESMTKSLQDINEMIAILAESDLPVFVIIGNRECKTVFNSALAALTEDFPNVFNLNLIRRVNLDDLDIVSMPGYHDPEYVHCPWDKCLYYESDTLSLVRLAKEADDPVMAVCHGPPRQKDRNGIDVVSEGANVGNPALTAAIKKANIRFGAFGNIQEAGGKATNLDGTSIVAQDTYVDSLYLNPGPADSIIWTMNDGTESTGMAAMLHFVGKKAKYKVFRLDQEGGSE